MNKIKQVLLFVGEASNPWYAAKVLICSLILLPALAFHEAMHLLVIGYGFVCSTISQFKIANFALLKVIQNEKENYKTLTSELLISYSSDKYWARACSIAPLYGYIFLIIYGIVCVHPFLLIYCVYAVRGFFLSDVDINTSETNGCNAHLIKNLRSFHKFIHDKK